MNDVCLSGGAEGSDTFWGNESKKIGHSVIHFSFVGHNNSKDTIIISQSDLELADPYLLKANETLKRRFPPQNQFVANLLRRNWYQVKDSDAVYAIGFLNHGYVKGGTAWAIQMFIDQYNDIGTIPCYIFHQTMNQWYQRIDGEWISTNPPKPSGVWTGIGSRDLQDNGKRAIRNILGVK